MLSKTFASILVASASIASVAAFTGDGEILPLSSVLKRNLTCLWSHMVQYRPRCLWCCEHRRRFHRSPQPSRVRWQVSLLPENLCIRYVMMKDVEDSNWYEHLSVNGRSVVATVVDLCPGCGSGSIDLSPAAFSQLSDLSVGRLHGVNWTFI